MKNDRLCSGNGNRNAALHTQTAATEALHFVRQALLCAL